MFQEEVHLLAREFALSNMLLVFHGFGDHVTDPRAPRCAKLFLRQLLSRYPCFRCCVCMLKGGFDAWKKRFVWQPNAKHYISMTFNFDEDIVDSSEPVEMPD